MTAGDFFDCCLVLVFVEVCCDIFFVVFSDVFVVVFWKVDPNRDIVGERFTAVPFATASGFVWVIFLGCFTGVDDCLGGVGGVDFVFLNESNRLMVGERLVGGGVFAFVGDEFGDFFLGAVAEDGDFLVALDAKNENRPAPLLVPVGVPDDDAFLDAFDVDPRLDVFLLIC